MQTISAVVVLLAASLLVGWLANEPIAAAAQPNAVSDAPPIYPNVLGDVNCSGDVNVLDALRIAQFSVGLAGAGSGCPLDDPLNQIYVDAGDASGDGRVNSTDALIIAQCTVGLPNLFCPPAGAPRPLVVASSRLCLEVPASSFTDGIFVQIAGCDGDSNQRLQFVPDGDFVQLQFEHSSKCLRVPASTPSIDDAGRRLEQRPCLPGQTNLHWTAADVPGGIELSARDSGMCLSVGANTATAKAAIQWPCTGGPAQTFTAVGGQQASARSPVADLAGVNLAGAEFGDDVLPGTIGVDYFYPTTEEVDFFVDAGMNVFRVPFRWERLQSSANAPFVAAELARLDALVTYATNAGAYVILDPHNNARYYGNVIGADIDVSIFEDFWRRLAELYKDNDQVIFGLMNEPTDMSTQLWIDDANAAITAIRDTGATNLILVPGNNFSNAATWTTSVNGDVSNAEAFVNIDDPINNLGIEVHQYLDDDGSGTSAICVDTFVGQRRLEEFTNWLNAHNMRAFLGEFGVADNTVCLNALDTMLDYVDRNNDVWIGWTYWAAGPAWNDYIYEVEPTNGVSDDAQFDILRDHLN